MTTDNDVDEAPPPVEPPRPANPVFSVFAVLAFGAAAGCVFFGFIVGGANAVQIAMLLWLAGWVLGPLGLAARNEFVLLSAVALITDVVVAVYVVWSVLHNWHGGVTPFM